VSFFKNKSPGDRPMCHRGSSSREQRKTGGPKKMCCIRYQTNSLASLGVRPACRRSMRSGREGTTEDANSRKEGPSIPRRSRATESPRDVIAIVNLKGDRQSVEVQGGKLGRRRLLSNPTPKESLICANSVIAENAAGGKEFGGRENKKIAVFGPKGREREGKDFRLKKKGSSSRRGMCLVLVTAESPSGGKAEKMQMERGPGARQKELRKHVLFEGNSQKKGKGGSEEGK